MSTEVSAAPLREQDPAHPASGQRQGHSLLSALEWNKLRVDLHLSRREIEMAQGVFDDWKDEQIAHQLAISHHTVNTYLHRLYKKLAVNSRPQLIVKVMGEYLERVSREQGESAAE